MKAVNNQEQGQVLILLVLIIFAFSSFAILPLLNFMTTGVVATRNQGLSTQEIYAAEAGVYDSIWKIIHVVPGIPKEQSDLPLQYLISGNVNGKSVNATISWIDLGTYRIHSVATNPGTNHQRTIDSDVIIGSAGGVDLSAFTEFAMTSPGTITTKPSDIIDGDVWIGSSENYSGVPPSGEIIVSPITGWPTESQLEMYFSYCVDQSSPYSNSIIDVSQPDQSGPLYAQGASNGNYTITGTGQLTGAIYVVGNLYFNANAEIQLNGNTIFVTGSISTHPQSLIEGPGGIIALGDISFSPQVTPSFILVMSVSGQVNFQPNGDFVGAVAGNANINLQPGCTLTWESPGIGNLEVPGLYNVITGIETWTIK